MKRTIEIYALRDPETRATRYIGASGNSTHRLRGHVSAAAKGSTKKDEWIRSLKIKGLKPDLVILRRCTPAEWQNEERRQIEIAKKKGSDLFNLRDGGIGNTEPRDSFLHIRASFYDVASYQEAARRTGWKLSEWVTHFLRLAAHNPEEFPSAKVRR